MYKEYGCDDMEYLINKSDRPGYIKVERPEKTYYLPIARVDNRDDNIRQNSTLGSRKRKSIVQYAQ